ncbi:M20 metallopeptidase family protein [Clostridium fallax]|uniref:Amidohydrolase n=1 Tax=Clostridium fallax TaxID=1533 RepID=A0A1M4U432_9CLOT|nr:M20 family metallopeptidase [Clostridium fallax]SHE51499.1 amidohydrolase [Clostridium fallax]SQB06070.1 amidohydrolase [Clostridium fallax]
MDFYNKALNIKDKLIEIRRDLHEHPELGFEEWRTSGKIKEFLEKEGIEYFSLAKTGVCGIIKGTGNVGDKEKVIALRADMDGLPIQDKKVCEYKSQEPGKMHACGHDAHTTILLGAAKLLNENKNLFSGKVKLIFEPAEETVGGARNMIEEGVLENPKVDRVLGLHVTEDLEKGKIKIKKGVVNAASNPFTIKIKGKGGHGAAPHSTVDPIVISSQVILALQVLASREISPVNPIVITVGAIEGGTAQNIIPDEVILKGIIRTMAKEDREYAKRRLEEIVKGITLTMRGDYEIEIEESYPCLYNDDSMVDLLKNAAKEVIGKDNVIEQPSPSMGVESFAYFAMERPSAFYFLGAANNEKGINAPAHNAMFDIDEECIPVGVAIQCTAALDYLTSK